MDLRINFRTIDYMGLIVLHVVLGAVIFVFPPLSKLYCWAILLGGILYVVKKQNRNHEALLVAAYITGAEVLLRTTEGAPVYEFSKYSVIALITIGMFYSGFSRNAIPYWVYLLLLIPGVVISIFVLNASIEDRKLISFVISGPATLGFAALYTYQRRIRFADFNRLLLCVGLPIISHTVYLILYTPDIRLVVTGTDSNSEAAGGFGPNQVSTVLGLGVFIFVSRAILCSPNTRIALLNLGIASVMTYRGIITFSRGGIITALVMIGVLIFNTYFKFNYRAKRRLHGLMVIIAILGVGIWTHSLFQTNGLIGKRYANQDASGRMKESRTTGREELAESELNAFFDEPIFGVGVGKSVELRERATGINSASHNEITRLLAEHGTFGIFAILILFVTPLILHLDNRENFYMLPVLCFWFFTINHASMRIAAPAFIYSLSLLKIYILDRPREARRQQPFSGISSAAGTTH